MTFDEETKREIYRRHRDWLSAIPIGILTSEESLVYSAVLKHRLISGDNYLEAVFQARRAVIEGARNIRVPDEVFRAKP